MHDIVVNIAVGNKHVDVIGIAVAAFIVDWADAVTTAAIAIAPEIVIAIVHHKWRR